MPSFVPVPSPNPSLWLPQPTVSANIEPPPSLHPTAWPSPRPGVASLFVQHPSTSTSAVVGVPVRGPQLASTGPNVAPELTVASLALLVGVLVQRAGRRR